MELQEFWKNCLKKWQDRKMKLLESWKKLPQKWQERKKKLFINFIERWDKKSNSVKVLCAAILSALFAIIFLLICFAVIKNSSEKSVGFWNFIILIVSSPVAFVIWQFRDENSRQQIENQRKDINLKEFQKLSEWVSGAHLPEINIEKSITKSSSTTDNESATSPKKQITEETAERSKEYGQKPDNAHWGTFSRRDGAVALQISAIYNLLPFFRGDYGESFRPPAFNLLKSAWQTMQQGELNRLNNLIRLREQELENAISIEKGRDISIKQEKDIPISDEIKKEIISNLRKKARSPMGAALTHVLLSPNRENTQLNLQGFPEMKSNLCLAGMDFSFNHQQAINSSIIVHKFRINLFGANLSGADLFGANLSGADLSCSYLSDANLYRANLSHANLSDAYLLFIYSALIYIWLLCLVPNYIIPI